MFKNDSFINKTGAAKKNVMGMKARSKIVPFIALLFAALFAVTFTAGCGKKTDEPDRSGEYAGELIYEDGRAVPQCDENDRAYVLLRYVTFPDLLYFRGPGTGVGELSQELKDEILLLKNSFAFAVAEGYDLSKEEQKELEENTKEAIYLTYQTDAEKRSLLEQTYDTYDPEKFCLAVYGMPFEWYIQVMRERAAAEKYISALEKEIARGITDDSVYAYYTGHRSEYDFAEADIILTARAPEDRDAALEKAEAAAGMINGSPDRKAAVEAAAAEFPDSLAWAEESGTAVLVMNTEYTGLYGEILKRASEGAEDAYVLEYENSIYIVLCTIGDEYTKEQLSENGISDTIRNMMAHAEAEKAAAGYGITGIREFDGAGQG